MENQKKKCSSKKHGSIDAVSYCQHCKAFFCNKCENFHCDFFENHNLYKIDQITEDIFTEYCKEKNHFNKLDFFCKNHNQLCCSSCISKIKGKGYGQHSNCDIYFLEDIKSEKKNKLEENIQILEQLSLNLEESINKLKSIFQTITEDKEELKLKIQNLFTKIRNEINEREDIILLDIDKYYDNLFIKEEIIKEGKKLPNIVQKSLKKGKMINKDLNDDNKLISFIFDCTNIENNIKDINLINDKIKICNSNTTIICSVLEDYLINNIVNNIKILGSVYYSCDFKFIICPEKLKKTQKYILSEDDESIVIKSEREIKQKKNLLNKLNNQMEIKPPINLFNNNNNQMIMNNLQKINYYLIEELNEILLGQKMMNNNNNMIMNNNNLII